MKSSLCLLLLFLACSTFAQSSDSKPDRHFLINTQIGYSYQFEDQYDLANQSNSYYPDFGRIERNLSLSVGYGIRILPNLYAGAGLSYASYKEVRNPEEKFKEFEYPSNTAYVSYPIYYQSTDKTKTISPYIFVNYSREIFGFLETGFTLYTALDNQQSSWDWKRLNSHISPGFGGFDGVVVGIDPGTPYGTISGNLQHTGAEIYDLGFIRMGLQPIIRLSIIKGFGMELSPGLLEYKSKTKDSRTDQTYSKSKDFEVSFQPEVWRLGFYLKF